jgi:hypothetical protein
MLCKDCQGRGELMIIGCPRLLVTSDVLAIRDSADDARRGFLPVAGGSLDQAEGAMEAIRYFWGCEAPARLKAGMGD